MKHQLSDSEIMAPVRFREDLAAVIQAGTGAIYFGIGQLNVRSYSTNHFTIDDLHDIADTCKAHGIKIYLTVNTVIYGEDILTMRKIIDATKDAQISAVIANDVAVITYYVEKGVGIRLSAQLNISNIEALKFYAHFADVVVLAHELNLKQVKEIHQQIVEQHICGPRGELIRIEMFCHGAFYMAISGKCYMSLHDVSRSANRGECVQICRRSYTVTDNETGNQLEIDNKYIMSPRDSKTVRFINLMMDAGVRMSEIEGRVRGPEYVYNVVTCYKEAIQSVIDGTFTEEKKDTWDKRLSAVFNRGFWDGYYQSQKLGKWTKEYGNKATEKKVLVGEVVKYFFNLGVAELAIEVAEIELGEHLFITGPTTGVIYFDANEICYELRPVQKAEKGWRISIAVPDKIRPNDKLLKIVSAVKRDARRWWPLPQPLPEREGSN